MMLFADYVLQRQIVAESNDYTQSSQLNTYDLSGELIP